MKIHRSPALLFFLSCCLLVSPAFAREIAEDKPYDFVIKNAIIFDGKSSHSVRADVSIVGNYISGIGEYPREEAREVLDADGLILAPGFIDVHTHSDFNPIVYPGLANKLLQGVTTEVIGNCGMSAAPVLGTHAGRIRSIWKREGVKIPRRLAWKTFGDYRDTVQHAQLLTNFVGLVGHGNLRSAVMGFANRRAKPREIKAMKKYLAAAMAEGAYGISFGLPYIPGTFANHYEIIALCREAARHSGICAFHMRSESSELLESIREVIRIAEITHATVQISHLKASGEKNWPKIDAAFKLIEEARARGVSVLADAYPYTAGYAELAVSLPDAFYERPDRVAYFRNPANRQKILNTLREHFLKRKKDWNAVMIGAVANKKYQNCKGKTLTELAARDGMDPVEVYTNLLIGNNFEVSAFTFSQSQEVVDRVIQKPYVAIGSDSIADGSAYPHPRCYGTFPRVIHYYVDGIKSLVLGEAIRKMTSVPAGHFGIKSRGVVAAGNFADLVLFDRQSLADAANYQTPKAFSSGVLWVFVNGKAVVQKGRVVGTPNGQFLTHETPATESHLPSVVQSKI